MELKKETGCTFKGLQSGPWHEYRYHFPRSVFIVDFGSLRRRILTDFGICQTVLLLQVLLQHEQ